MTCKVVQFSPMTKRPLIRKSEAITTIAAFTVGWLWFRSTSGAIGLGVGGLLISAIVSATRINKSLYEAARNDLAKRGYQLDFHVGHALIDSKSRVIAFVDLAAKTYELYDASDILGLEHKWIDKTDVATNVWGDNFRARTSQTNNSLVIKTSNPAKPLYEVPVTSHKAGEEWMARLGAILGS